MNKTMQQFDNSNIGLLIAFGFWIFMKISLLFQMITLAQFSSFCVIIGTCWAVIANADKAITNIEKFYKWYKSYKSQNDE
jgi:hypothetical protein